MNLAMRDVARSFELFIRCENCLRESSRSLDVSGLPDPPSDADELLESGIVDRLPFYCPHCDSNIGRLFCINVE